MVLEKPSQSVAATQIAITGGPCGGKTTLIDTIRKEWARKVAVVPEAASMLYRGGFPRKGTPYQKFHAQRAIFFTQQELEALARAENPTKPIVCDRGSLDGLAFWPESSHVIKMDFFSSLNTTREREFARYPWLIHLDTASAEDYEGMDSMRVESHQEAVVLNQKIREAWEGHPQRFVIGDSKDFLEKMGQATKIIQWIMSGKTYSEILAASN